MDDARAAAGKIAKWESNLLDLTVRNMLLSMRLGNRLTPIPNLGVGIMEDVLADGKALMLQPKPSDIESWEKLTFDVVLGTQWSENQLKKEFDKKQLRTFLTQAELEKRMNFLYKQAKSSIAETGSNTLYLSLGALRWIRPQDKAHRYAPLIMVPVDLNRKSVKMPYYLTARDEETLINSTLIEMLRRDYRIEIEGLDPLPEDEFGIDIDRVLRVFKRAIDGMGDWSIVETACLGLFSFSRFVMWKDIRDNAEKLSRSKVVSSLISGKLAWDAEPMEIGDSVDASGVLLPVEADASQLFAIKEAVNGKSFVLHGPPGTGKSQTITGVIANALAHDKRVLFVAEKAAALNVVYSRLENLGIAPYCLELHSNKATKSHMLDQLQQASEAGTKTVKSSYAGASRQIEGSEKSLDEYAVELHRMQPCGFTLRELICRYTKDETAEGIVDIDPDMVLSLDSAPEVEERVALAESMAVAVAEMGKPCEHPLKAIKYVVNSFDAENVLPRQIEKACKILDAFDQLEDLPDAIAHSDSAATCEGCLSGAEKVSLLRKAIQGKGELEALEGVASISGKQLAALLESMQQELAKVLEVHGLPNHLDSYNRVAAESDDAETSDYLRSYLGKIRSTRTSLESISLASSPEGMRYGESLQKLETALQCAVAAFEDKYKPNGYELGFDKGSFDLMQLASKALTHLSVVPSEWLAAQDFGNQLDVIGQLIEERGLLEAAEGEVSGDWLDTFFELDPDALVGEWNAANNAGLFKKGKAKRAFAEKIGSYAKKLVSEDAYSQMFTMLREIRSKRSDFSSKAEPYKQLFAQMSRLGEIDWESVRESYNVSRRAWTACLGVLDEQSEMAPTVKSIIKRMADDSSYPRKLQGCVDEHNRVMSKRESATRAVNSCMDEAIAGHRSLRDAAVSRGRNAVHDANEAVKTIRKDVYSSLSSALADLDPYFGQDEYATLLDSDKAIDQPALFWGRNKYLALNSVIDHLDRLQEWSMWLHLRAKAQRFGLKGLVQAFDEFDDANDVPGAFRRALYKMLVQIAIGDKECLNIFTGTVFEDSIRSYRQADERLRAEARAELMKHLAQKAPNLIERASQGSDAAKLKKAMRSRGRGTTIRKIFKEVPDLVQDLCPCMLMSPLSVAQYLDIDRIRFDIVIFDEASQLRTAMAVGALARAEDAIIVGDPNQMPPTSFFESLGKVEEWTEEEDLESILEDCLAISMPETYLQWHYRSEHESLISFSNGEFYRNKLCTFPSADDNISHVTYVPVDGYYEGNGACTEEAKAIVKEVRRRYRSADEKGASLGIITFNVKQQGIVEDLLDKAFYSDSKFEAWANEGDEPLFVKNLENVQGDERDVILLSVTYGPDETGRTLMRFGPLQNEGGWRRLNVAITRARKEMMVFAVLDPSQMDDSRINSKGVRALKDFLVYAKRGAAAEDDAVLEPQDEQNTDAIAVSICKSLADHGFNAVRNVGNSSYKVDIAVQDPHSEGRYLAGILLDGESYGRAKTTRDREISRVKMLESLGWNVVNVWSMDWWSRKDKVISDLVDYLLERVNESKKTNLGAKNAGLMSAVVEEERDDAVAFVHDEGSFVDTQLPMNNDIKGARKAENQVLKVSDDVDRINEQAGHISKGETLQLFSTTQQTPKKQGGKTVQPAKSKTVVSSPKNRSGSVAVKMGNGRQKDIKSSDIVFVKTNGSMAYIQTLKDGFPTREKFGQLELKLKKHGFFRPHRSYLINPRHVDSVEEQEDHTFILIMRKGKYRIPAHQSSRAKLLKEFGQIREFGQRKPESTTKSVIAQDESNKLSKEMGTSADENELSEVIIGWDYNPDEFEDGADWF